MSAVQQNDNMFVAAVAKSIMQNCELQVVENDDAAFGDGGNNQHNAPERVPAFVYINEAGKDVFEQKSAPWVTAGLMSACDYILSKWWYTRERVCASELMVCFMVEMLKTNCAELRRPSNFFPNQLENFPYRLEFFPNQFKVFQALL
jgi:hypothetical protein